MICELYLNKAVIFLEKEVISWPRVLLQMKVNSPCLWWEVSLQWGKAPMSPGLSCPDRTVPHSIHGATGEAAPDGIHPEGALSSSTLPQETTEPTGGRFDPHPAPWRTAQGVLCRETPLTFTHVSLAVKQESEIPPPAGLTQDLRSRLEITQWYWKRPSETSKVPSKDKAL